MSFLKNILAAFIGIAVFFSLLFILMLGIVAIAGSGTKSDISLEKDTILKIHLKQPLKDYGGKFEIEDFQHKYEEYTGLNSFLYAIKQAKTDNDITAISIESNGVNAGLAQIKALRDQLIDFKSSGKKVFAYGDNFSQKDYYLSSVADSIYINPVGELEFKGLSSELLYFKDLQEKTGVKMEVIRHGKYKSAVEPFLSNTMSDANREQVKALLTSIWNNMLADISIDRNIDQNTLNNIADSLNSRNPQLALKNQLVNAIGYYDEYTKALLESSGKDMEEKPNYVTLDDYAKLVGKQKPLKYKSDKIAVIYAQGDIMYTDGDEDIIGPKTIIESLKKARENDKIKAIVLRINSPGGSALASELIWREVGLTKAIKPVIVSMGNLAASGGYYIACNADYIIAEPATITGSIGVFGVLPNFKGLTDKIGINAEQVSTNKQASGYSAFEPLSDGFKNVITESIENIYTTFVQHVADGRKMNFASVDSIAQGRVWTGSDALKIGLVDELGGLDLAIEHAAQKVGIAEYTIRDYPVYKKDFKELLSNLGGLPFIKSKEEILKQELGFENYEILQTIKNMTLQKGVQVRLPFKLTIK